MKKNILIGLMMLVSVAANAANKNSSWSEIYAAGLDALFPQVQFNSSEPSSTVFLSVEDVCVAGDTLVSTKQVAICTEYKRVGSEDVECVKEELRTLSTPRTFTKTIVIDPDHSNREEQITVTYALNYDIPVGSYDNEGDFNQRFTKAYSIESCK